MIFMKEFRTLAKWVLIVLSCAAAFLPYLIPYNLRYSEVSEGRHVPNMLVDILPPIIWIVLVVCTLKVARWQRSVFWLFALFPVVFGPLLFILYFSLHAWLFGFAP